MTEAKKILNDSIVSELELRKILNALYDLAQLALESYRDKNKVIEKQNEN